MNFSPYANQIASLYRIAADQLRAPSAAARGAIADFEALIAAAENELLAAIAAKFEALRAAARARPSAAKELQSDAGLDDLVRPMTILRDYDLSRAELYRRCVDHPIGTPGGFSLRHAGETTYLISRSRFDRHFAQHPPRKRRNETEKPLK